MRYRTICTQLWTDKKVQRLSVQGKCLFVYLITNPHTHLAGIYYLLPEVMKREVGLSDTLLHTLFNTLSDTLLRLAYYDADNSIVFVRNMFRYQGRGEKNERAAAHHLETLHYSPLITEFLKEYPTVKNYCERDLLISLSQLSPGDNSDTLLDRVSDPSKRCPSVPVPSSLNSLQGKESEKGENGGRDYRAEAKALLQFLNEKAGKAFRVVPTNLAFIEARLKSGVEFQTCKTLIARKIHDWAADPKMVAYLRPETLFNKTKFESYLAEVSS